MKAITSILFVLILLLTSCEKDDENATNQEQNQLSFGDITYVISQGKLTTSVDNPNVCSITFTATIQNTTKSISAEGDVLVFTFELFQLDKNVLLGSYSLGDLNLDGMIDKRDAYEQGYLTNAYYIKNDENIKLKSGRLNLTELTDGIKQAEFDMRNANNERMIGTFKFE